MLDQCTAPPQISDLVYEPQREGRWRHLAYYNNRAIVPFMKYLMPPLKELATMMVILAIHHPHRDDNDDDVHMKSGALKGIDDNNDHHLGKPCSIVPNPPTERIIQKVTRQQQQTRRQQ